LSWLICIGKRFISFGTCTSGPPEPFLDIASVRQLDRVKLPLFLALVVDRLGSDLADPERIFGDSFKVVPPVSKPYGSIPSLFIESPGKSGIWETIQGPFKTDDVKPSLLDFFDWQQLGWRDFRHFLVQVDSFPAHPSLTRCRGLVEVGDVDVLWEPPGILGLPRRFSAQPEPTSE
jgi:hypothetical protein